MISATSAPLGGTSAATNVTSQKNAATCGMTFATEITKTLVATRDIRQDRRDVRSDREDLRNDRKEVRSDRRDLWADRRDIRADRRK